MPQIVIYCQPGASRTALAGWHDGRPKIALRAPPVDGAANKALIVFIAGLCGVPKSAVTLVAGAGSRIKRIDVAGVQEGDLRAVFGVPPG